MMNNINTIKIIGLFAILQVLSACTPADVSYCRSFGVEGTAEFDKCLAHYARQEAAFGTDRAACEFEADETYPPTLYDHGHYARSMGDFGPHGQYYSGHTIHIEPDWQHNREVDRLRMRIIGPCMQARGWNSANDWQAGRHAVKPASRKAKPTEKLPWQK